MEVTQGFEGQCWEMVGFGVVEEVPLCLYLGLRR